MTPSILTLHCMLFCDHNVEVLSQYFNPAFIEHSPYIANGLEGLRTLVNDCPNMQYECVSTVRSGEWEVLLGCFTGLEEHPLIGFDLYRCDAKGRPIEHWDALSSIPLVTRPPDQPAENIPSAVSQQVVQHYLEQRQHSQHGAIMQEANTSISNMNYDASHYVVAQGDIVFSLSEGHAEKQRYAIAELWRTDGQTLVDHWPTIVPIPSDEDAVHNHGLF